MSTIRSWVLVLLLASPACESHKTPPPTSPPPAPPVSPPPPPTPEPQSLILSPALLVTDTLATTQFRVLEVSSDGVVTDRTADATFTAQGGHVDHTGGYVSQRTTGSFTVEAKVDGLTASAEIWIVPRPEAGIKFRAIALNAATVTIAGSATYTVAIMDTSTSRLDGLVIRTQVIQGSARFPAGGCVVPCTVQFPGSTSTSFGLHPPGGVFSPGPATAMFYLDSGATQRVSLDALAVPITLAATQAVPDVSIEHVSMDTALVIGGGAGQFEVTVKSMNEAAQQSESTVTAAVLQYPWLTPLMGESLPSGIPLGISHRSSTVSVPSGFGFTSGPARGLVYLGQYDVLRNFIVIDTASRAMKLHY